MKKIGENIWLKNLPTQTPPDGMWERIESRMDIDLANEQLRAKLVGLPEHQPPLNLWLRIEHSLIIRKVIRLGVIASGIAATLLLAFVLKGVLLPESTEIQPVSSLPHEPIENQTPAIKTGTSNRTSNIALIDQKNQKIAIIKEIIQPTADPAKSEKLTSFVQFSENTKDISNAAEIPNMQVNSFDKKLLAIKPVFLSSEEKDSLSSILATKVAGKNIPVPKNDTLTDWLLARNSTDNYPPPPFIPIDNQPKGISIGFNYLPESMPQTDYGSSAYQTYAVMAKYQMPSVELRTALGISYQSTPMGYKTDYTFLDNSFGSGKDTIINAGSIDISGKERSSFLYYSIGAGKRIFSNKRISTSLQVGAGFSLLLANQNELSGPVFDALKNQSGASFRNTKYNIPDINQTHFDLVTGFDFNYRLHKRWSLSIEPTLKYYFNPIYDGNNSSPFSAGMRTGILFKL